MGEIEIIKKNTEIFDEKTLISAANKLLSLSLSENTRRAYMNDWIRFTLFCDANGFESLPASPETLVRWIASLDVKNRAYSSAVRSMTSIRAIHELHGYDALITKVVRAALRGLKRSKGLSSIGKVHAITWQELCFMIQGAEMFDETKCALHKRDAAVLAIGWAGALRRSEISALNIGDISFDKNGALINIRKSKTDQFGKGAKIGIPYLDTRFCPVKLLQTWIDFLSSEGIREGPLFRSLGMSGKKWSNMKIGKRLGEKSISLIVKRYAKYIGRDKTELSSHSLRRGFCTAAASQGVDDRLIMRHTRHNSLEVMRGYIQEGTVWQESPLLKMAPFLCSFGGSN